MILLILAMLALYCAGSVGTIWLICTLMGWPFSVPMAIGVWLIVNCIVGLIKRGVKK